MLCGDASKARNVLGWRPKVSFEELVAIMINADLELAGKERLIAEQEAVGSNPITPIAMDPAKQT